MAEVRADLALAVVDLRSPIITKLLRLVKPYLYYICQRHPVILGSLESLGIMGSVSYVSHSC